MIRIQQADVTHLRQYSEHLKGMPEGDKLMRFGYLIKDESIDKLILNMLYSPDDHKLWVARKGSHIVGWGHLAKDHEYCWELAVSVDHNIQNHGIGGKLIGEMLQWAKVHHIEEIYMHCIESNKKIQHLANKHNLKTKEREAGERTASLEVPTPSFMDVNMQRWKEHTQLVQEYAEIRNKLFDIWLK
jgi:GNAT superfamily N-acetyltransferase